MNIAKVRSHIAEYKHVRLAYLFGSQAKGKQAPLSDIDIAVFLDRKLSKPERLRFKIDLISALSSILKTDNLDLVVMNDSPTNLNYEIIKYGKILYARDSDERVYVESRILSDYLDRRYYETRASEAFLQKILERESL